MRWFSLLLLGLAGLAFVPTASSLPAGNGMFQLGMTRADLDTVIAMRHLNVLSDRAGFLSCTSDEPGVDFEQYVFYTAPGRPSVLWRVTFGFRLPASRENFEAVENYLRQQLGDPAEDPSAGNDSDSRASGRHILWSDASVSVQLGARWVSRHSDSDRMQLVWTDRRLQQTIDMRRAKDRPTQRR